jgi:hypothetical protein
MGNGTRIEISSEHNGLHLDRNIPCCTRTAPRLVEALLGITEMQAERIQRQDEQIELLKEEIRLLKGLNKRPRFKPSGMDEKTDADKGASGENTPDTKRPGSG